MFKRSLIFFAPIILSFSVFSFQTTYAEERPLNENLQIIDQQSNIIAEKSTKLKTVSKEIEGLENKKQTLMQRLESEKRAVDELSRKLTLKKEKAEAEKKRLAKIKDMFVHVTLYASDSSGNLYTPGNCTWYAKSRRPDLPNNLGNANTWYSSAQSQGWNVGLTPKKGAIAASADGMLGHVAYVEGVSLDGQFVTISEMNYNGLYSVNTRTVPYTDFRYIYELQ